MNRTIPTGAIHLEIEGAPMTAIRATFSILLATPIGWAVMAAGLITAKAMAGA